MIKKEMSIKRCLIAASMAGTMVLSSIPAVPVFAEETYEKNGIRVDYYGGSDSIVVYKDVNASGSYEYGDDVSYSFYTTKKPTAKKIPASNQWNYLKYSNYADISGVAKKSTYYFATTPNPSSLKDIVAVEFGQKAKAPAVKYAPKDLWVDYKEGTDDEDYEKTRNANAQASFTGGTNVMYWIETDAADAGYYEGYLKDTEVTNADNTKTKEYGISAYRLGVLQDLGAKMHVYEKGDSESVAATKDGDNMMKATVGTARPSKEKIIKIAKRANGPAVTIDYANHTLKLKKNSSVLEIDNDSYEGADTYTKDSTGINGWKTLDKADSIGISNHSRYAVKTAAVDTKKAASLPTFVDIASANASLASKKSTVAIVGEYDSNAILYVQSPSTVTDQEAFQWVVIDNPTAVYETTKVNNKDVTSFSYEKAGALKWKTVKTNKNTKVGTANLAWKTVGGKYVMIRKAAVGSEFSSNVIIYKAPADANDRWSFIQQHEYIDPGMKFTTSADAHRSAKLYINFQKGAASANALKVEYNGGDNTVNGKSALTAEGAKAITIELVTGKNVVATVGGKKIKKITYANNSISINELPDATAATDVEFTFPKGAIQYTINGQKVTNPAAVTIKTKYMGETATMPDLTAEKGIEDGKLSVDPDDVYEGDEDPSDDPSDDPIAVTPDVSDWGITESTTIEDDGTADFVIKFNVEVTGTPTVTISGMGTKVTVRTAQIDSSDSSKVNVTLQNTGTSSKKVSDCLAEGNVEVTISGISYNGTAITKTKTFSKS